MAGASFVLGAAACGRTSEPPATVSTTTTTGAQLTSDDAIIRLGGARCDREVACNNVGSGKKFESRYECIRELGKRTRTELLGPDRCRVGVSEAHLDDCVIDVKYARCEGSLEHLDRFVACSRARLCRLD
jgi:hypothetical protein